MVESQCRPAAKLAQVVRDAFPAISTSVERIFSAAGNVQDSHRGSLSPRMLAIGQAGCHVVFGAEMVSVLIFNTNCTNRCTSLLEMIEVNLITLQSGGAPFFSEW